MDSIESYINNLENAIRALKSAYNSEKLARKQIQNQTNDFENVNKRLEIRF